MWNPANYNDDAIGPMGLHDAYLLDAICRYTKPKVALEYGGLLGHSLAVLSTHCEQVISVDDNAHQILQDAATVAGNARVVKAKMQEYDPVADGVPRLDFVLIDASHLYADNIAAYNKFKPLLSKFALILIHDTGEWYTGELPPQWAGWAERRTTYVTEDRAFVCYLRESEGWNDITFQSSDHLRHGYTVLAKPTWTVKQPTSSPLHKATASDYSFSTNREFIN